MTVSLERRVNADDQGAPWLLDRMDAAARLPIPRGAKAVLKELVRYSNRRGECFPFVKTLALRTGYERRQVGRSLKWLEAEGYLDRIRRRRRDGSYSGWKFRARVTPMRIIEALEPPQPCDIPTHPLPVSVSEETSYTPEASPIEETGLSSFNKGDGQAGSRLPDDDDSPSAEEIRAIAAGQLVLGAARALGCSWSDWERELPWRRKRAFREVEALLLAGAWDGDVDFRLRAAPPRRGIETIAGLLRSRAEQFSEELERSESA